MAKQNTKHYNFTVKWQEPGKSTAFGRDYSAGIAINSRLSDIMEALVFHADHAGKATVTITIESVNDTKAFEGGAGVARLEPGDTGETK